MLEERRDLDLHFAGAEENDSTWQLFVTAELVRGLCCEFRSVTSGPEP